EKEADPDGGESDHLVQNRVLPTERLEEELTENQGGRGGVDEEVIPLDGGTDHRSNKDTPGDFGVTLPGTGDLSGYGHTNTPDERLKYDRRRPATNRLPGPMCPTRSHRL